MSIFMSDITLEFFCSVFVFGIRVMQVPQKESRNVFFSIFWKRFRINITSLLNVQRFMPLSKIWKSYNYICSNFIFTCLKENCCF